jgi:hypothetical protein
MEKLTFSANFTLTGEELELIAMQEGEIVGRGQYIGAEALQASLPAFERVWLQNLILASGEQNHLEGKARAMFPQGVIMGNVVGVADYPRLETIDGKTSIVQRGAIADQPLKALLTLAAQKGKLSDIGLSINGEAAAEHLRPLQMSGRTLTEITQIDAIHSIDFVTSPGAGGRIRALLASLNQDVPRSSGFAEEPRTGGLRYKEKIMIIEKLKTLCQARGISYSDDASPLTLLASVQDANGQQEALTAIGDALKAGLDKAAEMLILAAMPPAEPPKPEPPQEPDKPASAPSITASAPSTPEQDAKIRELDLRLSALRVKDAIDASSLPQAVKTIVASKFAGRIVEEAAVKQEIEYQQKILSLTSDEGKPKTYGGSGASVLASGADKVQQACDLLFGVHPEKLKSAVRQLEGYQGLDPNFSLQRYGIQASAELPSTYSVPRAGLRELYVQMTGDVNISFDFQNPSAQKRLIQASTTVQSTLPHAFGVSMNRRLLQDWMPQELPWRRLCRIKGDGLKDYREQQIIRLAGWAEWRAVAEGDSYLELNVPTEAKETYTPVKKGELMPITREAIMRDDIRVLNSMISMFLLAGRNTFHKAFFRKFVNYETSVVNDGAMGDGVAVYHTASHGNLLEAAITHTNMLALRRLVRSQKATTSNIWLQLEPKLIVVPLSLEDSQKVFVMSDRLPGDIVNDINILKVHNDELIVVDDGLLESSDYIYASVDPSAYPTLEVGFINNQQVPELILQNDPTSGNAFLKDAFTYKGRYEFGIGWEDYRGVARLGA